MKTQESCILETDCHASLYPKGMLRGADWLVMTGFFDSLGPRETGG